MADFRLVYPGKAFLITSGAPVVFVHGNPSWSFEFRKVVAGLSKGHRCIAPDHIGFGLSDKPTDWSYPPEDHAANLEALLESQDLDGVTLVVGDWGGTIGLSYAIAHPDRVSRLVITNTWLWPVNRGWHYIAFSSFIGGPPGRWLIRRRNFFASSVVKMSFGDRKRLTPEMHRHYLGPLSEPAQRKGCWTFPRQIVASSGWLGYLWEGRDALLGKDVLLSWGMKDQTLDGGFPRGPGGPLRGRRPLRLRGDGGRAHRLDRELDRGMVKRKTEPPPGRGSWWISPQCPSTISRAT